MKLTNKQKRHLLKGLRIHIESWQDYIEFSNLADKFCKKIYLDYVNNFLTVSKFASYYGITEKEANNFINNERRIAS